MFEQPDISSVCSILPRDPGAVAGADALGACVYTAADPMAFGAGAPGREVIGHELAHVVQQGHGRVAASPHEGMYSSKRQVLRLRQRDARHQKSGRSSSDPPRA